MTEEIVSVGNEKSVVFFRVAVLDTVIVSWDNAQTEMAGFWFLVSRQPLRIPNQGNTQLRNFCPFED